VTAKDKGSGNEICRQPERSLFKRFLVNSFMLAGILNVTAKDKGSGKVQSITIKETGRLRCALLLALDNAVCM